WAEEEACLSYTYDQALALLVFSQHGRWAEADAIVDVFAQLQNPDGSWFQVHDCNLSPPLPTPSAPKWEGDIAWMTVALGQYQRLGGTHPSAEAMQLAAADWLATQLNSQDGCLMIDHTEGTIDSWWALESAWPAYQDEVKGLENCLLTYYWDEPMGRFKGGREWYQPYLDNQTWGAAFLKAIGEDEKAKQALSYAYETLRLPTSGGELYGFDGQGGPWALWNEGTGQYVAVGGYRANDLLAELLAQQRPDGAMPSAPHNFSGAGVWSQNWHGVSSTAWLVLALNQFAFHRMEQNLYLPLVTN
ncbi:MAG: hypothetical protein KDE51_05820, partial [Anaerolineales bacterium]|nr:hypothetical protein [Anaerolineales bacterium]